MLAGLDSVIGLCSLVGSANTYALFQQHNYACKA